MGNDESTSNLGLLAQLTPGLACDGGVDTDEVSFQIDQGSIAVTGVVGRIGLDKDLDRELFMINIDVP